MDSTVEDHTFLMPDIATYRTLSCCPPLRQPHFLALLAAPAPVDQDSDWGAWLSCPMGRLDICLGSAGGQSFYERSEQCFKKLSCRSQLITCPWWQCCFLAIMGYWEVMECHPLAVTAALLGCWGTPPHEQGAAQNIFHILSLSIS